MVHVVTKGFVNNYYQWTSHGEPEVGSSSMQPNCNTSSNRDNKGPNPYRNMILEAAGYDFNPNSHENASQPQPPDPKTKRMLNIKSESRMIEKIYDDVMQVLEDALLPDNPYMFLTIIVPGPKNPKQRIDVFLQPLIKELTSLWKGVKTYDISKENNFIMRAILLWTINDFLAYGMLSGWSTARKKACPYCMENSNAFSLSNGGKTLGKHEKKVVCDWVSKLKFPDGYVSNMARCVDMKKYKMFVWKALTELSLFIKDLTCTTIEVDDMIRLHTEIPVVLCKLEKIFPPGFFDLMEHLLVHLPYEARVRGPVQYRWMYPFERFLGKLKKKVTNKAKVESLIANAYLIKEISMFCSHYFEPHVKTKMNRLPRNDNGGDEELYEGTISIFKCSGRVSGQAKKDVLLNCDEIEQYVKIFIEEIKKIKLNLTDVQVDTRLERKFANWFNNYVRDSANVDSQIIKDVASGPLRSVVTYPVYFVNGYKFYTSEHGSGRSTYNSGVCLKGSNYSDESNDYYCILAEIVQLEYPALPIKRVVLFRCDWFDPTPNVGMNVHKGYNLVDVKHKRRFNKYEPFILASQSSQVYYTSYPSLRRDKVDWWALSKAKPRSFIYLPGDNMAFQDDEVNTHLLDDVDPNNSDDASLGDDTD
nr:hypothetical protein [Tanacetum cinerariifolium]